MVSIYVVHCLRRIRHTIILDDPFDDPPELEALVPPASPEPQFGEVLFYSAAYQMESFCSLLPGSFGLIFRSIALSLAAPPVHAMCRAAQAGSCENFVGQGPFTNVGGLDACYRGTVWRMTGCPFRTHGQLRRLRRRPEKQMPVTG